jgi:hypothetical protein
VDITASHNTALIARLLDLFLMLVEMCELQIWKVAMYRQSDIAIGSLYFSRRTRNLQRQASGNTADIFLLG